MRLNELMEASSIFARFLIFWKSREGIRPSLSEGPNVKKI